MSIVYNTVYTVLIGALALRPPSGVLKDVRETWWPGMKAALQVGSSGLCPGRASDAARLSGAVRTSGRPGALLVDTRRACRRAFWPNPLGAGVSSAGLVALLALHPPAHLLAAHPDRAQAALGRRRRGRVDRHPLARQCARGRRARADGFGGGVIVGHITRSLSPLPFTPRAVTPPAFEEARRRDAVLYSEINPALVARPLSNTGLGQRSAHMSRLFARSPNSRSSTAPNSQPRAVAHVPDTLPMVVKQVVSGAHSCTSSLRSRAQAR